MDGYLKQSTASQVRWIGPFLDDTDFKTAETALTVANTDIKVSKNGGASASKNSGGGTHDVNGMYAVTWDATDTATVGELKYSVKVAGALPVFGSYVVVEEAVYDALFAASAPGYLQPTTAGRTLDVTATGGAGIDWANVENPTTALALTGTTIATTQKVDVETIKTNPVVNGGTITFPTTATLASTTGAVGSVTGAVGSVGAGGITAASFAANAINAAKLDPDVTTELQAGLATATSITSLTSDVAAIDTLLDAMSTLLSAMDTDLSSVLALLDDPRGEPAQGNPPVNPDLATKLDYLYAWMRNKKDNDGAVTQFYADDGVTVNWKQTTAESGGVVTKGEIATGA